MGRMDVNGIFARISRCIETSGSLLQMETSERMLQLFRKQNENPELSEKLEMIFRRKAETLHYYEWKLFRDFGMEAA
ncbi:MAG TPA: hypothetical protein VFU15_05060 [Bacteroidia bacterium]|nr:hypothetical protein [Bacteroidia bacterium]